MYSKLVFSFGSPGLMGNYAAISCNDAVDIDFDEVGAMSAESFG